MRPAWISAHILQLAYHQVRLDFPSWDGKALVTVPASFNTDQRNDTLRAATLAGFQDVHLLDEPTAAFYYFFDQNRQDFVDKDKQTVLVFDFGGGTLDVSIIRVTTSGNELCIDPIGRSRYNNLGGDDIDIELASFFLALWEHQEGRRLETLEEDERKELVQLFVQRSSAFKEEAEYYLANEQPLNEFILDHELTKGHRSIHFQCQLTRPQYEEISGRFFLDKGDLNVFRPIGQALDVARSIVPGFRKDDIDLVLYTGGASRMTGLRAALETYFAPKPCFSITDEEACNTVALGAASCRFDEMQGQRLRAYVLHHCLGRRKLLDRLRKLPLVPRQLLHMLQRRTQRHLRGPLRLIQQIVRAHRRRVQFFRVGQHPLLRLQQRVLVLGVQLRLRNFASLKAPQIDRKSTRLN